ncbi:hypothetical protein [Arthrobacter luteolus]|uniref:hypothetical protein n=1 Tax=Arthrobacter luteolus TaxID=98672 RepID=UPI0008355564|nr:hypothetical protein [Arthrobacter luteolus]
MATIVPDPGDGGEPRLPSGEIPEVPEFDESEIVVETDSEGHHYGVDREFVEGKPHREPAEPVIYQDYFHAPVFREHVY